MFNLRHPRAVISFPWLLAAPAACGGVPVTSSANAVLVAEAPNDVGVPDRGLDPSTVTLTNAFGVVCSGALIGGDVVLTSRHCVVDDPFPIDCDVINLLAPPSVSPSTIHVAATASTGVMSVATGAAILTSADVSVCGGDIAILILATPIEGIASALVSESGIAEGEHVRTVGLDLASSGGSTLEVLREHVEVLEVSASEFAVGQATCLGAPGSPAYDETTGQLVGILSRPGSQCDAGAQFDVFTRADVFYGLVQAGLAWAPTLSVEALDGGVVVDAGKKRDAGHAKKPPTDIGAACLSASDCGTGICVTAEGSQYCSRTCAPSDRCPTDYSCVVGSTGVSVCVQT